VEGSLLACDEARDKDLVIRVIYVYILGHGRVEGEWWCFGGVNEGLFVKGSGRHPRRLGWKIVGLSL
jgi:hypothetical protein